MRKIDSEKDKNALNLLKQEKVFTISQLVSILECSPRTAHSRLRQWRAYTSYNQNGKFYVLPEIPKFDSNGLWHFRSNFFSKHGNLKKTAAHLVCASESGLSGSQIGKTLRLQPRSFLHHLKGIPGIRREKSNGIFIYFSDEPDRYNQQTQCRLNSLSDTAPTLSDTDAVAILKALIKQHNISIEEIMKLPEIKKRRLSESSVKNFFRRHRLQKKILES